MSLHDPTIEPDKHGGPFPIEAVRHDTPGVDHVIHLNNAGAALPPRVVVDVMVEHLRREAQMGGYEAAAEATDRVEAVYSSIASLIGARPSQIAVVENATRAWDMAVYGFPFEHGDRVLTSESEYASNAIALLHLKERHDLEIVVVDDDDDGQVSLDQLDAELDKGAAMVALTHIPTNSGLVNPAKAVGDLCKKHGTFFVLDACQSVGHIPVDVGQIGCDVLSATGRKYLRGPRGTGFLFVSDRAIDLLAPPFLDLHAARWASASHFDIRPDARRFENWETNYASKLGLGSAVNYANTIGIQDSSIRICLLASTLRDLLATLPGVVVHDKGRARSGIVSFSLTDSEPQALQGHLARQRINTSISRADYARYDRIHQSLGTLIRASVHYYNTEAELEQLAAAIESFAEL